MQNNLKLRKLREEYNLTQSRVAEIIGISQKTYSKYEKGESVMPARCLLALCNLYKVSSDYILGRTEQQKNG